MKMKMKKADTTMNTPVPTVTTAANNYKLLPNQAQNFPKDLTEWVGSFTLVRLVLKAIERVNSVLPTAKFATATGSYQAPMLLTLLTYAYAKGIYGSQAIELAGPQNQALKYICAGNRLDWNTLRLFRRQNQKLIRNCLAETLKQAWEIHHPMAAQVDTQAPCYVSDSLARRLDSTPSPVFAREAENRLHLAILADTLQSDE